MGGTAPRPGADGGPPRPAGTAASGAAAPVAVSPDTLAQMISRAEGFADARPQRFDQRPAGRIRARYGGAGAAPAARISRRR